VEGEGAHRLRLWPPAPPLASRGEAWGTSPSPLGSASAPGVVVVDLNADGYDDVLMVDEAHMVAYFAGSPAGLPATPTLTFQM
jgi:hypothetical protein